MDASSLSANSLKTMVSLLLGGFSFHVYNCVYFEECDILILKSQSLFLFHGYAFIVVIFEKSWPNLNLPPNTSSFCFVLFFGCLVGWLLCSPG